LEKKKNKLFFITLLFAFQIYGQVDSLLIDHFVDNYLKREHSFYLNKLKKEYPKNDTVVFELAKFHLYYDNFNSFEKILNNSKSDTLNNLFFSDTCFVNYASFQIIKNGQANSLNWFNRSSSYNLPQHTKQIQKSFLLVENPSLTDASFLPSQLQSYYTDFYKYNKRKPIVAGLLSAIVPGLGKRYNGRKHTFLPSLLLNSINGFLAYESIHRYGIKNPYSIITTGMFSVFYLSNIYGSYYDLKNVQIEKRNSFLYEVSDYYSTSCLYK